MKLSALGDYACEVASKLTSHPLETLRKIARGEVVEGIDPATIKALTEMFLAIMESAAELFQNCPAPASKWAQAVRAMTPIGKVVSRVSIRKTCRECGRNDGAQIARAMLDVAPTFAGLDAALGEIAQPFDFIYG